ncbi:hypothetical protein HI113_37225 [Corallococcus exiguus]|uniref:hypothetical protein n=1 Tax=Corallococcus exiguus TaxID=83462 RepID=UPI001474755C|nr:hypothetical protein [Corallococcus exiguus]NNB99543.1 hypothetical protein [Corallococcus exiguus]
MNGNHMLRLGTPVGFGLFTLAGCGGPDAARTEPELSSVEQGINVATNGSFETHAIGSSNYVILNAGSTALPGWTITSAIKVMKSSYKAAHENLRVLHDVRRMEPTAHVRVHRHQHHHADPVHQHVEVHRLRSGHRQLQGDRTVMHAVR